MLSLALAATLMSTGSLIPIALRAENLTEPQGVATARPRLSWKLAANSQKSHNLKQSGYRIRVGTVPNQANLWDSGVVKASDTYGIEYGGKPLSSGSHCWWQVDVIDQAGNSSGWSKPSQWGVGLLEQSDWKGQWIGFDVPALTPNHPDVFDAASWIWGDDPQHATFERDFILKPGFTSATLSVTADDQFALTMNGKDTVKSDGQIDAWKRPHTVDVTHLLQSGINHLGVEAENTAGAAGLLLNLRVIYPDAPDLNLNSGPDWLVRAKGSNTFVPATIVTAYGGEPWGKPAGILHLPAPRLLRHEFKLKGPVKRAVLHASALGLVDAHLNGKRVSEDLFTPGWSDYPKRVYSQAYDVTQMVKIGENAMGVVLGDGWYSGYVGYDRHRNLYGKKTRAKVQLDVEYEDGTHQTVESSADWKAATGPIQSSDFLQGESYDATKELPHWDQVGFNDQAWSSVDTGSEYNPLVESFTGDPVRPYLELRAKEVTETSPDVYVLNLGQNMAGFARLKVKGESGQKITLRFAERLKPDGSVYTDNLRSARATDTYICRGGGEETWSPRFTFHGFQYIEVSGLGHKPTQDEVVGIAISSATPQAGTLETSDPMINRLIHNAWWTQKMNFIDVPTDCPQRDERLGWTGDAQAYVRTATMFTDVQAFFTKWLVALDDGQRPDGQFPMVAPLKVSGDDGGPAWADAGVICPWTIYEVYGDRALLARHYPAMKKFIEFCVARSTPDLLPPAKFHCFGDWLSINAPTPNEVIYSAYFAGSTRIVAHAARALGHLDEATHYERLYAKLREAFQKAYVTKDGRVSGESQCSYVLALAFDLLEPAESGQAAHHLVEDIEKRGNHLSTGFVGTRDIMHVLSKIGRNDVAYRLLHNTTFPSWGFTIANGATSIWERWDGWTPDKGFQDPGMNSFAHYAFGAVVGWMFAHPAGIDNLAPGFERVRVAPELDPHLTWLNSSYDSVRGKIVSDWKRVDGHLEMTVEIPPNVEAQIQVPAKNVTCKPALKGQGGVFKVGSGTYHFRGDL